MVWLLLLIPLIVSGLALVFFKHKLVWWEIGLPTLVSLITILIMNFAFIHNAVSDTEFITEYPIEARYYEDWNEYIHQTCTRTCCCDSEGQNCSTETYDCSYVDYHPEYWEVRMNTGSRQRVSQSYYNSLLKRWERKPTFKDMHRDYYTNDGDMYFGKWRNRFNDIEPWTFESTYTNKPQAAKTVFKFKELDSLERVGLYEYPKVDAHTQTSCIGCSNSDDYYLQQHNANMGSKYQIKVFVLLFDSPSIEIAERQRVLWKGGNKNELVVCANKNFDWVRTFSWVDDKTIEVNTNQLFLKKDISLREKISKLQDIIKEDWKRKEFADFEYIKITVTDTQFFIILGVVLLFSVGCVAFGIFNDIDNEDNRRNYYGYRR
jgi:hypothetical protein